MLTDGGDVNPRIGLFPQISAVACQFHWCRFATHGDFTLTRSDFASNAGSRLLTMTCDRLAPAAAISGTDRPVVSTVRRRPIQTRCRGRLRARKFLFDRLASPGV